MKKRYSEEQIIGVLKRLERGEKTRDLCRELGVSTQSMYAWKRKFGGMEVSEAKRLRVLESENGRLKKMVGPCVKRTTAVRVFELFSVSRRRACHFLAPSFYVRLRACGSQGGRSMRSYERTCSKIPALWSATHSSPFEKGRRRKEP